MAGAAKHEYSTLAFFFGVVNLAFSAWLMGCKILFSLSRFEMIVYLYQNKPLALINVMFYVLGYPHNYWIWFCIKNTALIFIRYFRLNNNFGIILCWIIVLQLISLC